MNFTEAGLSFLYKYAEFTGRSSRSEYWYAILFCALVGFGTGFFEALLGLSTSMSFIFQLVFLVPSFAIVTRRLHDIGKSGWWYLIIFTGLGAFLVLYWICCAGDEGDNQYGPNPLTTVA
jgi:uncharacterized membrane protein YhaH (DUF805 family)